MWSCALRSAPRVRRPRDSRRHRDALERVLAPSEGRRLADAVRGAHVLRATRAPGVCVRDRHPVAEGPRVLECDGVVTQRSEEHTSELQSRFDLVCRLLLEKKKENLGLLKFKRYTNLLVTSLYDASIVPTLITASSPISSRVYMPLVSFGYVLLLAKRPPPKSTLFPYTTLFR